MADFVVLGTDTNAGKTTFSLLWMAQFSDRYAYWKPVETGESDSQRVQGTLAHVCVLPTVARFAHPLAPALAARMVGATVPPAEALVTAYRGLVRDSRSLLIETFGSAFSPLTESALQTELIRALARPCILVGSSLLGGIGRMLQGIRALRAEGIRPIAAVLMGPPDAFAEEQLRQHEPSIPLFAFPLPSSWDEAGFTETARSCEDRLRSLKQLIESERELDADGSAIVHADRQVIWHPYTSLRDADDPLPVVAVDGPFLHLADGRKLIDGISSWWTILHQHRHPPLMAALRQATETYDHVLFAGVTHPAGVQLAESLLASMPWKGGRAFYSDNGSTAVEVALKMAYQTWCHRGEPQRTHFISFVNGYHGDTFGAMAVGRDPLFFGTFEPFLFQVAQLPIDAERVDRYLQEHHREVAGLIIEPLVQGAGGMQMHRPAELRELFLVAKRHGIFFIADEVMTGGGRTGTRWAFQAADIVPDLVCAAKTLAGGILPLAVTLASPEIVAAFDTSERARTFFHGHSFTAHPLACALGVANEALLRQPTCREQIRAMEQFWQERFAGIERFPQVREVRLCGTIAALEVNVPGGYLAEAGRDMRRFCWQRGVFLRPLGNVLYAMPPLATPCEQLEQIASVMVDAVKSLPCPS